MAKPSFPLFPRKAGGEGTELVPLKAGMVKIWRPNLDYGWAQGEVLENKQGSAFERTTLKTPAGQRIQGDLSNLKMDISTDPPGIRVDYFTWGTKLMASNALKEILEEFKVNAQYIPFEILVDGKASDQAFFCCNVLDVVDCIDYSRGEYTFWQKAGFTDHVNNIKLLAIDEKKTVGYHLFRIAKGAEQIYCVSDALAKRIEKGGFLGIKFVPPEEWNRL